jgi:hypothetical protein
MALFAKAKEPFLRDFLGLKIGVPSHDTFSRHFLLGNDLVVGGSARHAGRAINRLEIGLAIGSASARRGSSQIEVRFEA